MKTCTYIRKNLYLCTRFWGLFSSRNRDVAQLVAHYVRDVGVASSNLVIPTLKTAETICFSCLFFALYTTFSNFAVIEKQQFTITRDTKNFNL